jgi:hypothetical protein
LTKVSVGDWGCPCGPWRAAYPWRTVPWSEERKDIVLDESLVEEN